MRIKLVLAALLLPALLSAQELSPADGEIAFREEEELTPALIIGKTTKEKYLLRPGAKLFVGHGGVISTDLRSEHPSGRELGSVAKAKKPFLVQDILFSVRSNHIPGCVGSINIYRIDGKIESFVNVLHRPIYFDVAVSDDPQSFDIQPEETILLDPGRYFIAFQIVGYDEDAHRTFLAKPEEDRKFWEMTMDFDVYLKSSYLREVALGEVKPFPVNIGVAVKGLEYQ